MVSCVIPEWADEEQLLIKQLQSGDEAAFTALVLRWTPSMLRLAAGYVPNRQVAEDVVQETWLAVLAGIGGFEGRSQLRTWVFHILVRQAQRVGVRERRSLPFTAVWREDRAAAIDPARFHPDNAAPEAGGWVSPLPRWDQLPEHRLLGLELQDVIEHAIALLPRRQRQVITARDVLGCESAEVCELLAISPNYQRVLLHRARSQLRTSIEQHLAAELTGGTS